MIIPALTLIFALAFYFAAGPAGAATAAESGLLPECAATGACRFCDMVNVFITLGKWLVATSGGLALLMIVWAGVSMATSAGNPEKIIAAKKNIGGTILGMGAVLAAFQFVSILVAFVALPSSSETFQQSQNPDASTQSTASLSRFLGIPWWQICSEQDLRAAGAKHEKDSEYKGTAICRYWGDNTPCGAVDDAGQAAKRCCRGVCASGECAAVVVPEEIRQTITPIRPPTGPESGVICNQPYGAAEQAARTRLGVSGRLGINNGGFENGRWCGNSKYQDYRSLCDSGCTNVGGLQERVFGYLETIKNNCNGFTITGGSELGHSSTGGHDQGLAIDLVTANPGVFGDCLRRNINNDRFSFIRAICTTETNQAYRYNCDNYDEDEEHFHLSFE